MNYFESDKPNVQFGSARNDRRKFCVGAMEGAEF